ncbi:ABC transporter ATP-binding protein [Bacillota bacterium LX-D]|nr:ABC transporter ATP-binding protein [Bacillota bacterium LX-D]
MIEITGVNKSFEDFTALKNISLKVKKGSIYGLVGSNGAGKTTLLKTIAGIYKQDTGQVRIENEEVFENVELKAKVSFIPDALYFFTNFTIQEMAKFYSSIYPSWNVERYTVLQKVFKLDVKKRINRLSKGMQRQVAFWLALSTMPEYLLLDEPLDGLDPVMRQKVKNLIVQDVAEREMTVLISSHNLKELEDLCDSIGILHEGTVLLEKDLDDLKADTHKIQIAFKGNVPENPFMGLNVLYIEERGSVKICIIRGNRESIVAKLQNLGPAILDILPLTLEEIFIYEMGDVGYEASSIIF